MIEFKSFLRNAGSDDDRTDDRESFRDKWCKKNKENQGDEHFVNASMGGSQMMTFYLSLMILLTSLTALFVRNL